MQVLLGTRPSQPRIGHVELVARITEFGSILTPPLADVVNR